MKNTSTIALLVVALAFTRTVAAAETGSKPAASKGVAVVFVGLDDKALADQVVAFMATNLRCPVRQLPTITQIEKDPGKEAEALSKRMEVQDGMLIALFNVPEKVSFAGGTFQTKNVAMVNIRHLRPEPLDGELAQQTYLWRVEKESMRAVALLAGAQDCPFPRCAIFAAKNDPELDRKARNFCPPCYGKVESLLKARGITVAE